MSSIKILAKVEALEDDESNGSRYRVSYVLTEPAGTPPHQSGEVFVHFDPVKTETETNALIQQAVAEKANLESGGVESFTANDVRGGRI